MLQDVRYSLRLLFKNFGFTSVVVLTLALGIGANAALFSVVNTVLLKPLPFPDSEQLVTIHQSKPNFEAGAIPFPNFLDLQRENQTLSSIAISRPHNYTLVGLGEAQRVDARLVTADFFEVLRVTPQLGRTFVRSDDSTSADPTVVVSSRFWAEKFGSSFDVLEKNITLDEKSYRIVGVLPPSFALYRGVDLYVPIMQWNSPAMQRRSAALGLHGIGRMKPGVTVAQAQSDLERVMQALAVAYPETNKGNGAKVVPMLTRLVGDIETTLWTLLAAVGFVLLIACVNVSNLLLARSTARSREYAIRAALGANSWRLLRQSLTETTILALTGGALGLAIAAGGTKLALSSLPTGLPRAEEISVDLRVVLFTLARFAGDRLISRTHSGPENFTTQCYSNAERRWPGRECWSCARTRSFGRGGNGPCFSAPDRSRLDDPHSKCIMERGPRLSCRKCNVIQAHFASVNAQFESGLDSRRASRIARKDQNHTRCRSRCVF